MFLDTQFNSVPTVLANLYQSFLESAVRCFEYVRHLSALKEPSSRLLISKTPHSEIDRLALDRQRTLRAIPFAGQLC